VGAVGQVHLLPDLQGPRQDNHESGGRSGGGRSLS
jgi:hypothetical protein